MKISLVVATSNNGCIGINNTLPWSLPKDLKRFKSITTSGQNNVIIMGRKTYESIGRPLPGRTNCVLTKNLKLAKGIDATTFQSLEEAIEELQWWEKFFEIEYDIFIIGGSSVFSEAIEKSLVNTIYHTLVHEKIEGDTFLSIPDWNISQEEIIEPDEKNIYKMTFRTLTRP